jgi:hypothetical protein
MDTKVIIDKLNIAIELAKRTMAAYVNNKPDFNTISLDEAKIYYDEANEATQYFLQLDEIRNEIFKQMIAFNNAKFDQAIQDMIEYIKKIGGIVDNLEIASEALKYIADILVVFGAI